MYKMILLLAISFTITGCEHANLTVGNNEKQAALSAAQVALNYQQAKLNEEIIKNQQLVQENSRLRGEISRARGSGNNNTRPVARSVETKSVTIKPPTNTPTISNTTVKTEEKKESDLAIPIPQE